jgi:hypothetical protein
MRRLAGVEHEGGVGDVMLPCGLSKSQTICCAHLSEGAT